MHLVAEVLLYGGIAWVICVLWWHLVMRFCFMGPPLVEFDFCCVAFCALGWRGRLVWICALCGRLVVYGLLHGGLEWLIMFFNGILFMGASCGGC